VVMISYGLRPIVALRYLKTRIWRFMGHSDTRWWFFRW